MLALLTVVLALAAPAQAPDPDRVELYAATDPGYAAFAAAPARRTFPDEPSRLVVLLGGKPVLDRGLRADQSDMDAQAPAETLEDRGEVERAVLAPDHHVALVQTFRYVRRTDVAEGAGRGATTLRGTTDLTWVDPYHPGGKWTVKLEPGRWVKQSLALARRRGAAVATFGELSGQADFRVYGPDGREVLRVPESEALTLEIAAAPDGSVVAADQGHDSGALGDRGILVVDPLTAARWTYWWKYGSDAEPASWSLESGGVLVVSLPGKTTRRYGAGGKPVR